MDPTETKTNPEDAKWAELRGSPAAAEEPEDFEPTGLEAAAQARRVQQLRVLIIEDSMQDAELSIRQLKREFEVNADVVETREAFVEKVRSKPYDVILADYHLPYWTGTDALALLKKEKLEIPVILLTGAVSDETAAACMKMGLADYVLKQRLARLPSAVRMAIEEKALREEAKRAEATRSLLAAIVESSEDAITGESLEGVITSWNGAAHRLYGYSPEEAVGRPSSMVIPAERSQAHAEAREALRQGAHVAHLETVRVRKDGTRVDVSVTLSTIRDREGRITGYSTIAHDITGLKRAQDALREANAYNRNLIETSLDPLIIIGLDGTVTDLNSATERVTGCPRAELIGADFAPYFAEPERALAGYRQVLRDGRAQDYELEVRHRDGHVTPLLCNGTVLRDQSGEITGVLAVGRDITEHKRVEQQLQLQAAALASAANAIVITDRDGQIIWVNPAFATLTGYTAEEAVNQKPRLLKSGQHDAAFYKNLWDTILSGRVWHGELVNRRKDGTRYTEEMTITPVSAAGGQITHFVAIKQDISERKRVLEELMASEVRYRRLFERSQDAILVADSQTGRITDLNPAALTMLEETPDRILGRKLWEIDAFRRAGAKQQTFRNLRKADLPILPKSGKRMDVEIIAISYHAGDKEVIQYSLRDVTVRLQAEQAVKALNDVLEERVSERTQELATLNEELSVEVAERRATEVALARLQKETELTLNSAGEAILRIGLDGNCTFANPAAIRMFGYSREELLGRNVHTLCGHRMADGTPCELENCQVQRALKQGAVQIAENQTFTRRDGTSIWVDSVTAPMTEGSEIVSAVQILRDVSDRRAMEKMKDEFVSVVSHELRTPLTAIRGALGLLARGKFKTQPTRAQHLLDLAVSNTDRLTRLINDILDTSRMESAPLVRRLCTACELATQAADLMRPMAETARVQLTVDCEPLDLAVDPDAILQVLTNLLSNAIKFSPPASEVRVEVVDDGKNAVFRVIDRGQGIPADKLESIFGRFQPVDASDSRKRGGSGLGLSICRGIIQRHGGKIWAESKPGRGSTFVFTIPLEHPPE